MQKACIAIVLALTLSCVVADYNATSAGYVKAPLVVAQDNETDFTAQPILMLNSLAASELSLTAFTPPAATGTPNTTLWTLFTKKIDAKALSAPSNTTYKYNATQTSYIISNGYAIATSVEVDNATNFSQIYLYQTKVVGGSAPLPRVAVTSNNNAAFFPSSVLPPLVTSKTIFIFALVADKRVNVTTLSLGGGSIGKDFTLTSSYEANSSLKVAASEALTATEAFAIWIEGEKLNEGVVDATKGIISNNNTINGYNTTYKCSPFVTDKKNYGVYCTEANGTTYNVYVTANNTNNLTHLFTADSANSLVEVGPYSGYLAFYYSNGTTPVNTTLSYEIWDIEAGKTFRNLTTYMSVNPATSTVTRYRVQGGGVYTLAYNDKDATVPTSTFTNVQVGLLLGGSYLTTVFGFLLTIIAGLFLF